jgi:hypothetical protein
LSTEKELKDKIAKLKGLGEDDLVAKYERELATMQSKPVAEKASAGDFVIPVTEEEFEKITSKFAQVGLHVSEFGMPEWKTPNVSIAFPFTITEGVDKGKGNEITAGVAPNAVWKLREILTALEVPYKKTNKGQVAFSPMDVVGKIGKTQWIEQKDTRSVEEGGKGTTYTKPVSVLPLSASAPEDIV